MADPRRLGWAWLLTFATLATSQAVCDTVRVASIQFESANHDFDGNLGRARGLLKDAADRGAQVALLPEFALLGYDLSPRLWTAAETRQGRTVTELLALSRSLGLYIGTSFLEVEGEHFYNTFFLATPSGTVAGWVRKQSPAGAEGYFFRGHENPHVIETPLGRIGVGVCQENYRCFLPYALHEARADILLMPYSYPDLSESGGLASPSGAYTATWYAGQLGIPVVTSNKTGVWPQVEGAFFPGRSAIVAAGGEMVAELDHRPGLAVADVGLPAGVRPMPELDCIGAFISNLTLGSWFERRMTWSWLRISGWLGIDPDRAIAESYEESAARKLAARRLAQ